jgi:hypothetical protein
VGRVIVYKSRGGYIRQGDPSLITPLLNRARVVVYKNRSGQERRGDPRIIPLLRNRPTDDSLGAIEPSF